MISFRPLPWLTAVCVLALLCLVALGNWQIKRLAWKTALIESVNDRSSKQAQPLSLMLADAASPEEIHFARVYVAGEFLHDHSVYMFTTQGEIGVGYFLITPLQTADGRYVLINRGFLPKDLVDSGGKSYQQPQGRLSIEGLVRLPDQPSRFTPEPDLPNRVWFNRDLTEMVREMGLEEVEPIFVDAVAGDDSNVWPRGGMTRLTFSNNHLGYALTWYGLAIALLGVYIAYHIKLGRLAWGRRRPK